MQIKVLMYRLEQGIVTSPSGTQIIVIPENIWNQIEQKRIMQVFYETGKSIKNFVRNL